MLYDSVRNLRWHKQNAHKFDEQNNGKFRLEYFTIVRFFGEFNFENMHWADDTVSASVTRIN